jgi:eukaryotic-like serine/threonine-protein kinase
MRASALSMSDGIAPSRYRVITELGSGGTARVFLAVLEKGAGFQKLVVLKTLLPHLADDPTIAEMFRNEARIAARLKHPHVVEVYEVVDDGGPVLVMEYLRGASLRELVRRAADQDEPLPLRNHLEVIYRVCLGLHYCHELRDYDGTPMGLIHRDVSPHNVYLTFQGEVRLLDFGIAKLSGNDGDTRTGFLKGKIRYMAPEQMLGEDLDRRADLYAIGVMLWEAITCRDMWVGVSDAVLMQRTVNGELPEAEPLRPVPQALLDIMKRCLALSADDRYATAGELASDLEAVMQDLPRAATSLGVYAEQLYGERDHRIAALVQAKLSGQDLEGDTTPLGPIDWTHASRASAGSARRLQSRSTAATPGRRHIALWLPIGAAAIASLAWWMVPRSDLSPASVPVPEPAAAPTVVAAAEPAPAPQSAPVAAAVPKVERKRVHLTATPIEATLSFDGKALASNPFDNTMLADGELHTVSASAPGYVSVERSFVLDEDVELVLELVKEKDKADDKRKSTASSKRKPPEAAPKADCDPPFYIDAEGVKRFKRQCL